MSEAQKLAIGAVVRSLLLLASASLISRGWVQQAAVDAAVSDLALSIVGWLGALGTIAWSLLQKYLISRKVQVALVLPAKATSAQLDAVMAVIPVTGPLPNPAEAAALTKGVEK